ncbi:uncharacterized protein BDZ99DRAFT_573142 [Mytilinidion resinicola]|uniref:BTB domain-containing protein n=1 Tax=Mytilinidion resinicola TaxID=574789 RepID=A0A6A6YGX8_9PEZI|nr:uncharacterized protein BDZ99DRAFT_573142 [Mytilinidion resinicola]KAF2807275.1 hypothetical protein BDZ99DRAFT_573142 [Mytilinidion resinicola]
MAAKGSETLEGFRKGGRRLYISEHYSDLTIVCRNGIYKIQKAVICPRSAFFATALRGLGRETEEVEIDLSIEDPKMVERMICFFYNLDYLPKSPNSPLQKYSKRDIDLGWARGTFCINHITENVLKIHALMYAMGDKYGCSDLKITARAKFEAFLECSSSGCSGLVDVIPVVFGTTPDSDLALRDLIVEEIVSKDYLTFDIVEDVVGKTDGFPYAILKAMNLRQSK